MSLSTVLKKTLLTSTYVVLSVAASCDTLFATEVLHTLPLENQLNHKPHSAVVTFQPLETNLIINHPEELVISFEGIDMRSNLHLLQKTRYALDLAGEEISFEILSQLKESAPFIYSLDLRETLLTNKGLQTLSQFDFQNLRKLSLSGNRFDDEGLPFLSGFKRLTELHLAYNKITPKALPSLKSLPLEVLDLGCTYLENEGIRMIPTILPNLRELDVRASGFDESVLDVFFQLAHLQNLNVTRTKISSSALKSFLAKTQEKNIKVQAEDLIQ